MNSYEVQLENDQLLNVAEFADFCAQNQNQDIRLHIINEGHCLQFTGVYKILDSYKFNSVQIITANALETHRVYSINNTTWNYWLNNITNFDIDYDYSWNRKHIFGCFYGRPSAPRLGIAAHLVDKYNDQSFVKTKFDFSTEESRKLFDITRLFAWDNAVIDKLPALQDLKYYADYEYCPSNHNTGNLLNYDYKNFLIDIVSEPSCKGNAFYPTEKIVRAMLCKHPFIVMANKNYLIYLRQLGFKTFYDYWDEDYDGFDGKDKYWKVLELIDSIAKRNDLEQLYSDMEPLLEHNYSLLLNKLYSRNIVQVD